jgi:membrane-associated phospholipid phosphatase
MKGASRATRWVAAAILFLAVEGALIAYVDKPLSLYLRQVEAHDPNLIDIFRAYTRFAKADWYLWPSGLGSLLCLALVRSGRLSADTRETLIRAGRAFAFFFAAVAIAGLATGLLKPLIGRARPVQLDQFQIYGFDPWSWFESRWNSLPSGEATTAFVVAVALIILFPRWQTALWAFAVVMAASRVMINAHFLSDIVAGAAVGSLTALAVAAQFRKRGWIG